MKGRFHRRAAILPPFSPFGPARKSIAAYAGTVLLSLLGLASMTTPSFSRQVSLQEWLDAKRIELRLPAMGAVVLSHQHIRALAVSGVRYLGGNDRVQREDAWHLGSIGKSITATMIARLVEKGAIAWNSRVMDIFPNLVPATAPAAKITLSQLLSHTSGLTENMDDADFAKYAAGEGVKYGSTRRQRLLIAKKYLNAPLLNKPGQKFLYSNLGYLIAAAMAEKAANQSWEHLVRQEVFIPLDLRSAGMGAPGYGLTPDGGPGDQPQGHMSGPNSDELKAVGNFDNPAVMGPAGTIHMNLDDLAKYVGAHLQGALGLNNILKAKTYAILHTPKPGTRLWLFGKNGYGYGWAFKEGLWGGDGPIIWHNGSNGAWYGVVQIRPKTDTGLILITNAGSDRVMRDIDATIGELFALSRRALK